MDSIGGTKTLDQIFTMLFDHPGTTTRALADKKHSLLLSERFSTQIVTLRQSLVTATSNCDHKSTCSLSTTLLRLGLRRMLSCVNAQSGQLPHSELEVGCWLLQLLAEAGSSLNCWSAVVSLLLAMLDLAQAGDCQKILRTLITIQNANLPAFSWSDTLPGLVAHACSARANKSQSKDLELIVELILGVQLSTDGVSIPSPETPLQAMRFDPGRLPVGVELSKGGTQLRTGSDQMKLTLGNTPMGTGTYHWVSAGLAFCSLRNVVCSHLLWYPRFHPKGCASGSYLQLLHPLRTSATRLFELFKYRMAN